MDIIVRHERPEPGVTNAWRATVEGLTYPGVGPTWSAAMSSLLTANLIEFGVKSIRTLDPFSEANPDVTWTEASSHEPAPKA